MNSKKTFIKIKINKEKATKGPLTFTGTGGLAEGGECLQEGGEGQGRAGWRHLLWCENQLLG